MTFLERRAVRNFISQLWMRRDEGLLTKIVLFPLWVVSLFVAVGVRLRRALEPRKAHRAGVPVISVGNVTVGGTGKTPVTIELARRLTGKYGRRAAILSRGYGRQKKDVPIEPVVVSDGENVLTTAAEGGDEPVLMARALPGVPVVVCPDRTAAAALAIGKFGAQVLLLDDGFQHLKLARDLDIVLTDGSNPVGNGFLMPRGPLREPFGAIRHAGLAWITRMERSQPGEMEALAARLEKMTGRPPVFSATEVSELTDVSGTRLDEELLREKKVLLASGLGRPETFRTTAESLGCLIAGERQFDDHHVFEAGDVRGLIQKADELGADFIAVTAKDAVKLAPLLTVDGGPKAGPEAVEKEKNGGDPEKHEAGQPAESPVENSEVLNSSAPTASAPVENSSATAAGAESAPSAVQTAERSAGFARFVVVHIRLKIISGEEVLDEAIRQVLP